ncbi:hypothetical protein AVEN_235024-1 [Araneus ventricosus]|uniref:Uncharacterized protein n=1 Tax=Araneus ventricosus TaxID=182803 RepID=A0A4Y2FMR2_ARAVE|nr:hypothetical protein AVEN_235024-1 [Araneus ventricosus]
MAPSADLQLYVNYIDENYYKFQNRTEPAALSEYCNKDGDEQLDLYDKIIDAYKSLEKLVCAQPDQAALCSRGGDCIDCVFLYLEETFPDDDCKID